eukprot:274362_1
MYHMVLLLGLIYSFVAISMANTVSYDESAALEAAYYAFGAYCPADCLQNWDCKAFCPKHPHFAIHSVVTAKKHALQAFTGYDPQTEQVVISFRGTQNNNNLLLDFDWEQMYFKDGNAHDPGGGLWAIHKGFYWGMHELYDKGLLSSLQELFAEHQDANVLITGHSLGGALAQILALLFKTDATLAPLSIGHINIITFGAPRWGSKDVRHCLRRGKA